MQNLARSALVKKRQQSSRLKATIPQLRGRLRELEQSLVAIQQVKSADEAQLAKCTENVESSLGCLFDEEYVGEDLHKDYVDSAQTAAQKENEIANRRAEERKASLHLSLLQSKRNATLREIEQVERMKNELDIASQAEELQRLELNKRIKDDQSRIKHFSGLHDRIRAETAQCTNRLTDVEIEGARVDCSVCQLEQDLHGLSERSISKLHDLNNARKQNCLSREIRARKRTERCGRNDAANQAIKDTQCQKSMINTLTCTLRNAEKEVEQAKGRAEQGKLKVESVASQLGSRCGELEALRRDLHQIDEDRRRDELAVQTREKELERLHLKVSKVCDTNDKPKTSVVIRNTHSCTNHAIDSPLIIDRMGTSEGA